MSLVLLLVAIWAICLAWFAYEIHVAEEYPND